MQPKSYDLAEDTIDRTDLDALSDWLKQDPPPRLTMGPLVRQYEQAWSQWLDMQHSVMVNSGSSANLLMYEALRYSQRLQNKRVIVPSVGWATTIAPALQLGFEPLMCEADPDTFGLDLNHLEDLLKQHQPSTVVLVQVLGVPHKMEELLALKQKYNFFLLEDACAAAGSSYRNRKVGSFGDLSSFSFYFGHQTSTIEGGMVSTNDPELHNLLVMLRSHGWDKDVDPEHRSYLRKFYKIDDFHAPFAFYLPGYNVRSTDLNAFLGLRQLQKIDWLIQRRHENHHLYRRLLGSRLCIQHPEAGSVICSIHFGALADSTAERKRIVQALFKHDIETRIFSAGNLGRHPMWQNYLKEKGLHYDDLALPMANKIHDRGFFLPNNPSLRSKDIEHIVSVVLDSIHY